MTELKMLWDLKMGSQEALCWFIDRYTPYVTTLISNIIGETMTRADIEEVAADVFFVFWRNSHKVKFHSVRGYLGAVARNLAKNKLRELGKNRILEDDTLILEVPSPEGEVAQKELAAAVRQCVNRLPMPEREIFLRYYFYYQTVEQISDEMGINLSTIKTKMRRGRSRLKAQLKELLS